MAAIDIAQITDENVELPANSEAAPPTEESSGVPAEVLELPIVRSLLDGSTPAIYNESGAKSEELNTIVKNGRDLKEIGIAFFHDPKAKLDLAYNTQYLDPAFVKAAAAKGKLKEIAESYTEVSARINAAVGGAPAAGGVVATTAGTEMNLPDTPINTARISNLSPGSPTSGAAGQGRVLNSLLRPTI